MDSIPCELGVEVREKLAPVFCGRSIGEFLGVVRIHYYLLETVVPSNEFILELGLPVFLFVSETGTVPV